MREKLNENPVAQIALIGVLALVAVVILLHPFGGGGGESESAETPGPVTVEASIKAEVPVAETNPITSEPAATTTSAQLPAGGRVPRRVEAAYRQGETIVLLVYRPGGTDDKLTRESAEVVAGMSGVAFFKTEVGHIARYAQITGPLGVDQAPALIVVQPKQLNHGASAPATVTYGFQTTEDIRQAIVDSRYRGPELTYAPN